MKPWYNLFELMETGDTEENLSNKTDLLSLIKRIDRQRPNVFWSVSAGKDFRGLVYLSDSRRDNKLSQGIILEKPDLYVFNCLGSEFSEIENSFVNQDPVFEDKKTQIIINKFIKIKQNRHLIPLAINPQYVSISHTDPMQKGYDGALIQVKIQSTVTDYSEIKWVLYLENENINILHNIFYRKGFFSIMYLCAAREGLGCGGCRRSILEHITEDYPRMLKQPGKMDIKYIIQDFVYDLNSLFEEHNIIVKHCEKIDSFIKESDSNKEIPVYQLRPRHQIKI